MLVVSLSVSACTVGIVFDRRAYNNVFARCDIFECRTCIDWRASEDNGERNTLIGCTLFNSDRVVRIAEPVGALYLEGCSVDYAKAVYVVEDGLIFATDCHHEGKEWIDGVFQCVGYGARIMMCGGVLLGQARPMT